MYLRKIVNPQSIVSTIAILILKLTAFIIVIYSGIQLSINMFCVAISNVQSLF